MGLISLILLSITIITVLWALKRWLMRPFRTPEGLKALPGPYGVPLLGIIPWVSGKPHLDFLKLSKKYGNLFMVPLGEQFVVVIHDIELIREAYAKDLSFAGRPEFLTSIRTIVQSGGQSRFVFRTGNARWRFLRKSAVKALSLFASSRNSKLNEISSQAADELTDQLKSHDGEPFNPHIPIFEATAKVIGRVNFGGDYRKDDPLLEKTIAITEEIANFVRLGSAMDFIPFMWIFSKRHVTRFLNALAPVNDLTAKLIEEHDCSETDDQIKDIADALFVTAQQTPDEQKKELGITDAQIRAISQDLFGAGFGTTMETLRWALNLLACYPDKQSAGQQEIDKLFGKQEITLNDLHELPYINAILLEVYRVSSLIPLSLPHSTMNDTQLRGYHVPKNVIVFANIYAHHRDPKYFPDPHAFKPERYLTKEGRIDMQLHELVVPFGVGKRRCVGEAMARQEMFLLIARILQKLEFRPAPGVTIDPENHGTGITRRPVRYDLLFKER